MKKSSEKFKDFGKKHPTNGGRMENPMPLSFF